MVLSLYAVLFSSVLSAILSKLLVKLRIYFRRAKSATERHQCNRKMDILLPAWGRMQFIAQAATVTVSSLQALSLTLHSYPRHIYQIAAEDLYFIFLSISSNSDNLPYSPTVLSPVASPAAKEISAQMWTVPTTRQAQWNTVFALWSTIVFFSLIISTPSGSLSLFISTNHLKESPSVLSLHTENVQACQHVTLRLFPSSSLIFPLEY